METNQKEKYQAYIPTPPLYPTLLSVHPPLPLKRRARSDFDDEMAFYRKHVKNKKISVNN